MQPIDLRSDTVTLPSPAMRQAMATAEVGDDVMGEDPTVNRLEAMTAERLGKEAAVFVVSGTMGNLVALLAHCGRGEEMIVGDNAHIFMYEAGGSSALGGIHSRQVPNQTEGTMDLTDIEAAIRSDNPHFPRSRLICLENTHNRCGGACLTPDYMGRVRALADKHDLRIHLDGARVFNASIALGIDVTELTRHADSVMFCLSKGLSAPIGSLVCGRADFIHEARRARKVVGGGMRQVGVIAAAGIFALENMVDRMAEDHDNARLLAEGLAEIKGIVLDPTHVQTNIVFLDLHGRAPAAQTFCHDLAAQGVKMLPTGERRVRAVTHYGIGRTDIDKSLEIVSQVMR